MNWRVTGLTLSAALVALTMTNVAAAQTPPLTAEQCLAMNTGSKQKPTVAVEFVNPLGGQPTLVAQSDGTFAGQVVVRVYCKQNNTDYGDVGGLWVTFSTTVPNATIDGQASPVKLSVPTGRLTITITSSDPGLDGLWKAQVGSETVTLTGGTFNSSDTGRLMAETPELGSLLLFGSGLVAGGFYLARRRIRQS